MIMAGRHTMISARMASVGRASMGDGSLLPPARWAAGSNLPSTSAVSTEMMGIIRARCHCGDRPIWAISAPNTPAEKKPKLQKACARFMMRRPMACSTRSASRLTISSMQPITRPTGTSSRKKVTGEGAQTAMA